METPAPIDQPPSRVSRDEDHDGPTDRAQVHGHVAMSAEGSRANIGALLFLLLLVNLASSLYTLPLTRVVERRLCSEFYSEHDPESIGNDGSIPEDLCKIAPVQTKLAWILAVMDFTWILGDFFMTIPLGFLAERYGRKAVLWLNLVARFFMLSWAIVAGYFEEVLPVRAIMAGPVLSVLGGDCVFNSLTYALAAGMTNDSVQRATCFGWMSSITYVVALLGPALASASMTVLLWLPFWIGLSLLCIAVPTIWFLPSPPDKATNQTGPDSEAEDEHRPLLSSPAPNVPGARSSPARFIRDRLKSLSRIFKRRTHNLSLLFVCFFLISIASSDTKMLPQYISKRFHWTFAATGYLLSAKAVVNFCLLVFVVPQLLKAKQDRGHPDSRPKLSDKENVSYAKFFLLISAIGALAIAVVPAVWLLILALIVYALGSVIPVFTLSMLKPQILIAGENHESEDARRNHADETADLEAHLFSLVMMVRTMGSLLGAPLMATLWVYGITLGTTGFGLPYFSSAVLYALALLLFADIKL